jgi:hypothetical protein
VDVPFDFMMEKTGLSPEEQIKKLDADISNRKDQELNHQVQIAQAEGELADAKTKTEAARYKKQKKEKLENR